MPAISAQNKSAQVDLPFMGAFIALTLTFANILPFSFFTVILF